MGVRAGVRGLEGGGEEVEGREGGDWPPTLLLPPVPPVSFTGDGCGREERRSPGQYATP